MAQLSDDCFAFGGDLILTADALSRLEEIVGPAPERENVSLSQANGRILAFDVKSEVNVPPHDNAAVDGWAVYFDDLNEEQETSLPWHERIPAGIQELKSCPRGMAVRIFTGAPMPKGEKGGSGPDTVLMQEDCREIDGRVFIPPGIKRGANRRKAGEDIKVGDFILSAGRRLKPQDIGLMASVGFTQVQVYCPLRVGIFSTGDEVVQPGKPLSSGGIYDSNRFMIISLLQRLGCEVSDLGILPDSPAVIRESLDNASSKYDALITSGGVSTGEEDHVKAAIEKLGSIYLWRLAIRPGRPIALGQIGHVPFIGLPGNPVAVLVTFLCFARPLLLRLSGVCDVSPRRYPVIADFDYKKKKGRREWLRVRLRTLPDGRISAEKFERDGAGILSSAVFAEGLIELAEEVDKVKKGMTVDFLSFNEMMG